ncbi:hypothetical protein TNCV_2965721 [Trichonephila clavipes]|nr:hypothetical protein TNCV_2965721 [Trichonephila clavipes]
MTRTAPELVPSPSASFPTMPLWGLEASADFTWIISTRQGFSDTRTQTHIPRQSEGFEPCRTQEGFIESVFEVSLETIPFESFDAALSCPVRVGERGAFTLVCWGHSQRSLFGLPAPQLTLATDTRQFYGHQIGLFKLGAPAIFKKPLPFA